MLLIVKINDIKHDIIKKYIPQEKSSLPFDSLQNIF
jgi:hypothetical protein